MTDIRTEQTPAAERPLVTFALFAYNQEKYIREAVEGAFSQTYEPLEIILSDDCSTDRTYEIIEEMAASYLGPHKIVLNRNERNLGIGQHFNRLMVLASGEVVEIAAGDDISLPHRTVETLKILESDPNIMCVSLGLHEFRERPPNELIKDPIDVTVVQYQIYDFIEKSFLINAPARAFRKFAHNSFGPLDQECPVEDGPNLLRCLLYGRAAYSPKIGVLYRWNGENVSSPINILKIPFSLIYKDYHRTISIALKNNLITVPLFQLMESVFRTRQIRWEALSKVNFSKFKPVQYIKLIALSKHFTKREKLSYLKRLILGLKLIS